MTSKSFKLVALINNSNPQAVRPVLENLIKGRGSVRTEDESGGFFVQAEMEGSSAKELNRLLLSALRKVEKRTTLRAEWTATGSDVTEKFFDYVLKKTITIGK